MTSTVGFPSLDAACNCFLLLAIRARMLSPTIRLELHVHVVQLLQAKQLSASRPLARLAVAPVTQPKGNGETCPQYRHRRIRKVISFRMDKILEALGLGLLAAEWTVDRERGRTRTSVELEPGASPSVVAGARASSRVLCNAEEIVVITPATPVVSEGVGVLGRTRGRCDATLQNDPGHANDLRMPACRPLGSSSDLINFMFRAPSDWICDPAVDVRFMPAGPVGADFELSGKGALGDLTVDGGARQTCPGKNGFQADDTVFSNRRVEVKHFRALSPG